MLQRFQRWLRFNWMYLGSPPWDTGVSPPELMAFIAGHPAGMALDLGCGTGTNLVSLAKAGWTVVGVDFALKAIETAKKKLRRAGLPGKVIQGDVTRVDLPGVSFDLVLDIGCFHGLPAASRTRYIQNLTGYLANGGTFLIYLHLMHAPGRVGVTEDEIAEIGKPLQLVSRTDSLDRFGRQASWLTFLKPA